MKRLYQGKMATLLLLLLVTLVCGTSAVSIMPELKHNILRFGYGVNFRYEGMLAHSFDTFYVVTRIEIPKVSDLNLTCFNLIITAVMLQILRRTQISKFQVQSKTCLKYIVRILFHTCICINIKWNITKRWYMIS